jgi:hypothetical protein
VHVRFEKLGLLTAVHSVVKLRSLPVVYQCFGRAQPKLFNPEDGGRMFIRIVGIQLGDYVVQQPRWAQYKLCVSSTSLSSIKSWMKSVLFEPPVSQNRKLLSASCKEGDSNNAIAIGGRRGPGRWKTWLYHGTAPIVDAIYISSYSHCFNIACSARYYYLRSWWSLSLSRYHCIMYTKMFMAVSQKPAITPEPLQSTPQTHKMFVQNTF